MSDFIIRAEGLAKKYRLLHRKRVRYVALRDVLAQKAKSVVGLLRSTARQQVETEEFWALKNVSFEIASGEVVGIIGRNGAGKSTLLKILSRITEPSAGKITIRGRIASLLEVGTGFHPELTGRENIFLNGAILGMSGTEIRKNFDAIVDFADVEKFLDTPVKHYSSGMYVRLAFAVAAHLEPEILVIDEVLAVGDVEFQKKCLSKMGSIAHSGRTVLFVSHQLDTIQRLCTRALVLDKGAVSFAGNTVSALAHYRAATDSGSSLVFTPDETRKHAIKRVQIDPDELRAGNILLKISFSTDSPLTSPCAGVVFHDERGQPLFGSNTIAHPLKKEMESAAQGEFRFRLNKLALYSGQYSLSLWLNDGLANVEYLPSCFSFSFQDPEPLPFPMDPSVMGSTKISPEWSMQTD